MIVDCHMHVNWLGHNVHTLVKHLDDLGVDKTWLLTWELVNGLSYPGYVHLSEAEVWAACEAYPDRFVPFYAPDPQRPDAERVLRDAIKKGLKGFGECKVRLCLDNPDLFKLFRIAADNGLPILLHLDVPFAPPWDFWYCYDMDRLGQLLAALPHANFIGHGPGFWRHISGDEAACDNPYPTGKVTPGGKIDKFLKRYPNLYCDLSAGSGLSAISRDPARGKRFLVKHSTRILYGTDYYDRRLMDYLYGLGLESAVLRRIMGQNAMKLIP